MTVYIYLDGDKIDFKKFGENLQENYANNFEFLTFSQLLERNEEPLLQAEEIVICTHGLPGEIAYEHGKNGKYYFIDAISFVKRYIIKNFSITSLKNVFVFACHSGAADSKGVIFAQKMKIALENEYPNTDTFNIYGLKGTLKIDAQSKKWFIGYAYKNLTLGGCPFNHCADKYSLSHTKPVDTDGLINCDLVKFDQNFNEVKKMFERNLNEKYENCYHSLNEMIFKSVNKWND